jgi:hypothetical protein
MTENVPNRAADCLAHYREWLPHNEYVIAVELIERLVMRRSLVIIEKVERLPRRVFQAPITVEEIAAIQDQPR